eukprot:TRINITY_DN51607_c0_g1_i1.p1 TRINITY_DN51607_c0_g1~~TRINITY_DN51607_c0_g1_i1.p1  ORF type:complete len:736 (+),score=92.16 TRINITY_DN51607_c0_g1_i1:212-2209(+)
MNVLTATLVKSAVHMYSVLILSLVILGAFCLMAFVAYGHTVEQMAAPDVTISSLLRMLIGDIQYEQLETERPFFSPFFFALFMFSCLFVLLNMIIAVLSGAFEEVRTERQASKHLRQLISWSYPQTTTFDSFLLNNFLVKEVARFFKLAKLRFQMAATTHPEQKKRLAERYLNARISSPRGYWDVLYETGLREEKARKERLKKEQEGGEGQKKKKKKGGRNQKKKPELNLSSDTDGASHLEKLPEFNIDKRFDLEFGAERAAFIRKYFIDDVQAKTNKSRTDLELKVLEFHHHWLMDTTELDEETDPLSASEAAKKRQQTKAGLVQKHMKQIKLEHVNTQHALNEMEEQIMDMKKKIEMFSNVVQAVEKDNLDVAMRMQKYLRIYQYQPNEGKVVKGGRPKHEERPAGHVDRHLDSYNPNTRDADSDDDSDAQWSKVQFFEKSQTANVQYNKADDKYQADADENSSHISTDIPDDTVMASDVKIELSPLARRQSVRRGSTQSGGGIQRQLSMAHSMPKPPKFGKKSDKKADAHAYDALTSESETGTPVRTTRFAEPDSGFASEPHNQTKKKEKKQSAEKTKSTTSRQSDGSSSSTKRKAQLITDDVLQKPMLHSSSSSTAGTSSHTPPQSKSPLPDKSSMDMYSDCSIISVSEEGEDDSMTTSTN